MEVPVRKPLLGMEVANAANPDTMQNRAAWTSSSITLRRSSR
jgi:hypothetical protein